MLDGSTSTDEAGIVMGGPSTDSCVSAGSWVSLVSPRNGMVGCQWVRARDLFGIGSGFVDAVSALYHCCVFVVATGADSAKYLPA